MGVIISLTDLQFKILKLRFGDGWSFSKIANHLGLSIRSIKKLLDLTLRKEFTEEMI